jgi:hypothetical protein
MAAQRHEQCRGVHRAAHPGHLVSSGAPHLVAEHLVKRARGRVSCCTDRNTFYPTRAAIAAS